MAGESAAAPKGPEVIIRTVESSEATVLQGRQEIPVGVGGQPIERAPYDARLAAVLAAGTTIKRWAGQERCLRVVTIPLQGGKEGQFHCSRAAISAGVDGEKYCPEHDKAAFQPQQDHKPTNQKTFNSASIVLSEGESNVLDEKGAVVGTLTQGRDVAAARRRMAGPVAKDPVIDPGFDIAPTVLPKRARAPRTDKGVKRLSVPKGSGIVVRLTKEELDSSSFIDILRDKIVDAINELPAINVREMEDVIRVRERVKEELRREE